MNIPIPDKVIEKATREAFKYNYVFSRLRDRNNSKTDRTTLSRAFEICCELRGRILGLKQSITRLETSLQIREDEEKRKQLEQSKNELLYLEPYQATVWESLCVFLPGGLEEHYEAVFLEYNLFQMYFSVADLVAAPFCPDGTPAGIAASSAGMRKQGMEYFTYLIASVGQFKDKIKKE